MQGIKYLRQCGMSIEAIKDYCILRSKGGDAAVKQRYDIVLEQKKLAQQQLEEAKQRVDYLTKKADNELRILNHQIPDSKNPGKKYK